MKFISTLALSALLSSATSQAQTSDLIFFTDDGVKFTLVVDGDVKNEAPASRVLATGIRNESPMVIVRFEDAGIPQLRKPGYFPLGMEYTVMITTNKKGERVLRPTGEAALGTTAQAEPERTKPTTFVEDKPMTVVESGSPTGAVVSQSVEVGGVEQVTTVIQVDEVGGGTGTGSEGVQINMGINGMGINMGVKVDDGSMGTTTTRTTTRTTTTVTSSGNTAVQAPAPTPAPVAVKEPEAYRMPGYSGPVGCAMPMTAPEFADARKSIEGQSFEDTRMTLAKQIGRDRCFSTEQVKSVMAVFSFEDTRLEFAKYAYDRTHDIGNYYKVNEAFSFSSSVDDLNKYIQSR